MKCIHLSFAIVALMAVSCTRKQERVHVIPDGMRGWMVILENRKDGYDPHLDSKIDIYLYLFDGRGVCKTKSGYADSWGSDIFVWQNGSVINSAPDAPGGAISIRQRENGMIGNDTESKFCYSMFFIGSLTELEKHKQDGDRKIRQLLEATR